MALVHRARIATLLAFLSGVVSGAAAADGRHALPPADRLEPSSRARLALRTAPAGEQTRAEWPDLDLAPEAAANGMVAPVATPASTPTPAEAALLRRIGGLTEERAGGQATDARGKTRPSSLAAAAAAGAAWVTPALLADPNHANDQYVSLAVCPTSGNLYAVFEGYDLGSTDRDIHIARSDDDGESWEVWELPSFTQDEMMPDVAVDGGGYIHVVWARADGVIVRARSSSPDDPQAWAWVRGLSTGSLCATPSIAVSGAGDFARVFIAASMVDYGEWTLLWMWSTTGGGTVSYDYLDADGYPDLWPDVALDGATAYLVNAEQDTYTGRTRILIARDALSGSFADIVDLTAWTSMNCGYPSLAVQGQDVFCAYQLDWDDGQGHVDGDIIYAFSWDGLTNVYGPYEIAADTRETVGPAIFTRDGVVGILYLDAPANGDEFNLVARLAGGRGHPDNWLTPETVAIGGFVSPSFRTAAGAIGLAPAGGAPRLHAAWSDKRNYPAQGLDIYRSRRATLPNLAPFTPSGWSGPLVASLEQGGRTTGLLAAEDTTWVSLAFWNDGLAGTTRDIVARLNLDGATVAAWLLPGGLPTATYVAVEDHPLVVGRGAHDLALVLDPLDAVAEELEDDNVHVESLWFIEGEPVLRFYPTKVMHVFPPPASAAKAAIAAPPLVTRSWLPVVSDELSAAASGAAPDALLRVVVTPAEQVDAVALGDVLGSTLDPHTRRATVAAALREHASRQRGRLEAAHSLAIQQGRLGTPRELWLSGQLVLRAAPDAIAELAADPAVGRLWLDDQPSVPLSGAAAVVAPMPASTAAPGAVPPVAFGAPWSASEAVRSDATPALAVTGDKALAWHLNKIGAPAAWAQGLDGTGVLVGHLDTGVNYNHPDLAGRLWDGGIAYPHHGYDFVDDDADPLDGDTSIWHGTHTAGLVAGGGTGGTATGAAPGARLMSLRCVPGYYQDLADALQFAVDHGADLITFSAGWVNASSDLRASLRANSEALLAAGVPWISAAGNGDNAGGHVALPRDIASPGDCPGPWYGAAGHSAVITVGATDQNDAVGVTSSRGPTSWTLTSPAAYGDYPYPPGLLKPDLAAPGVSVTSTIGASGYATYTGTSMAAPLVAGAAAILLQARPLLSPAELAAALEGGAHDVGASGRDTDTGAGRLDIPTALALLPETAAEAFWVRNVGPLPLKVTGVTWRSAWLSVSPRTATIAPGDSSRFVATFDPATLPAGTHYDEVVFSSNDPQPPRPLSVVATLGSDGVTDVPGDPPSPGRNAVLSGHPNPFNPRTVLRFDLSSGGRARLVVYGLDGRRLRTLVDAELPAGEHEVVWDGCDDHGRPLASGTYLARLTGPSAAAATRKLALVR